MSTLRIQLIITLLRKRIYTTKIVNIDKPLTHKIFNYLEVTHAHWIYYQKQALSNF